MILVFIPYSGDGSNGPAQIFSLAKAFSATTHKERTDKGSDQQFRHLACLDSCVCMFKK